MFRKWSTSFCVYNILITTHLQPEYTTNSHETRSEQSIRRRKPIHRARILTLPNIHIHFNKYAFSHYQICVFVPHFVVVYVYTGTINRPLQLLVVCQNAANNLPITQHSPTKHVANTPLGVGGRFIAPVSSHYQICVSLHHFVGVYVYANTIKLCTNVHLQLAITQQHTQNAYFRIAKTILLRYKNPLFARQKPYFCNAKTPFLVDPYIALIKH